MHIKTDQLERQISLALSNIEGEEACFSYDITRVLENVRASNIRVTEIRDGEFAWRIRLGSSENPACVYALYAYTGAAKYNSTFV